MLANIVTFDSVKAAASERYGSHLADIRRPIELSKPESLQSPSEESQTQTDQVKVTNKPSGAEVIFALDKRSEELYIQVVDRETGEVLREIPSVEMRRLVAALEKTFGHLLDSFA